jgi:hypothetical protein
VSLLIDGASTRLFALRQIAVYSARQAVEPTVWGITGPLLLILLWLGRRRWLAEDRSAELAILVMGVVTGAAVLAFYYLASFDGPPLDWWLSTGLDRTAMPAVCLVLVGAFLGIGGEASRTIDKAAKSSNGA